MRKGERGTTAIFYSTQEKENDAGEVEYIPMLKTFNVFNVEQIDSLLPVAETVSTGEWTAPTPVDDPAL